ncbi:unnamed protein product [Taenia asiatica]|uniref:Metaxin glutathione S-transferase domain-containing protein n=1 Tax=Taenia asiatica TaxID=60517 RepID=A0A3P6QWN8_TAEAS|nr:unnamed protein product [Taenia asiatica]
MEYGLSDEELAHLESLVTSVERRVTPACRWLIWADTNVYRSYTSLLYRSNLSYLQGLWYPRRWRDKLIKYAEFSQLTLCADRDTKNRHRDVEVTLYEGAIRCLTALSYILGDKQFFLGDKPSAIDAYVFGRLWPLLNYDRVCRQQESKICHRLISHIYQCENLLRLCCRVQRLCFPAAIGTIRSCECSLVLHVYRIIQNALFPPASNSLPLSGSMAGKRSIALICVLNGRDGTPIGVTAKSGRDFDSSSVRQGLPCGRYEFSVFRTEIHQNHTVACAQKWHQYAVVEELVWPTINPKLSLGDDLMAFFSSAAANAQIEVDEKVGAGGGGWFSSLFSVSHSVPTVLPTCLVPFRDGIVFGVLALVVLGIFGVGSGLIGFGAEDEAEDVEARATEAEDFTNFIEVDE